MDKYILYIIARVYKLLIIVCIIFICTIRLCVNALEDVSHSYNPSFLAHVDLASSFHVISISTIILAL